MSLLNIISLNISDSSLIKRVSLYTVSVKKSIVKKTAVKCDCKDQKMWCATEWCAYYKMSVWCEIAYNKSDTECLNIQLMNTRI